MASVVLSYEHDDDLEPESTLLVVDGSANGERVRFVVDTGTKMSNVPDVGVVRELEAIGTDIGPSASAIASGDDLVIIDELIVGDLTATMVQARRSVPTTRALLGMDVLGDHCCHFQFSADRLVLDEPDDSARANLELARHVNGSPLVDVDFDNVTVQACWDTGASLSVVDERFARTHPQIIDIGVELSGLDAEGPSMSGTAGVLAACRIGGQSFESSACIIFDLGPLNATLESPLSIIVGMPLAKRADWLFDFPNNHWLVTPH